MRNWLRKKFEVSESIFLKKDCKKPHSNRDLNPKNYVSSASSQLTKVPGFTWFVAFPPVEMIDRMKSNNIAEGSNYKYCETPKSGYEADRECQVKDDSVAEIIYFMSERYACSHQKNCVKTVLSGTLSCSVIM